MASANRVAVQIVGAPRENEEIFLLLGWLSRDTRCPTLASCVGRPPASQFQKSSTQLDAMCGLPIASKKGELQSHQLALVVSHFSVNSAVCGSGSP